MDIQLHELSHSCSAQPSQSSATCDGRVGFLSLYMSDESDSKFGLGSCREQLLSEISRLLYKYKGEELSITLAGHSMGSSLALLLAYGIAEPGLNKADISKPKIPSRCSPLEAREWGI
ncbi:Fungal lipase-like domain [Dillenia turbinata]|uniref:Fungal lipase-like domain n=1 Tax=Dillenia turbinata TaxID=194707 RepID=A0AAN8VMY1_9MAGN